MTHKPDPYDYSKMTAPEVPATNDPQPWRYYDGSRRAEPLNQDAGNPFASLWVYDPRPEFDAEVPADEGTRDNYTPTVSMLIGQELAERLPDSATTDEEFDALQAALVKVFATELQKARAEGEARAVESWTVGESAEVPADEGMLTLARKFAEWHDQTEETWRDHLDTAAWFATELQKARAEVIVTTVDDLEALPIGSVVRLAPAEAERVEHEDGSWEQGAVAERRLDSAGKPAWFFVGRALGYRFHQADLLPARVLWVGGSA